MGPQLPGITGACGQGTGLHVAWALLGLSLTSRVASDTVAQDLNGNLGGGGRGVTRNPQGGMVAELNEGSFSCPACAQCLVGGS